MGPFVVDQSIEWGRRLAAGPSTMIADALGEMLRAELGPSSTTAEAAL